MKYVLVFLVIFAAIKYLKQSDEPQIAQPVIDKINVIEQVETDLISSGYSQPKSLYECDGREYCSQMNSYEEAVFFNTYCPEAKMDGDGDGIPCERQFGR
ncbi:excalibur calcium-binding domain-containing protein [Paraferrimonas sedimenticola]|uniref:Excalibur calcium-binding domain-containing protein n=1 Tax=Paraferrimonas sedimenticola TaxID=375674 RepID=A0AA37RV48_9GAMM|nr:excalibur calcium-binding domain-containing protein [Paraferrimonas sedimenticola]GLP95137.1 hypothetical protein GCM10007895_04430 [Paraferrimonas sedimenticola]